MLIKRVGDYMAWLGGAEPAVLAQVPSARGRFVQMAAVLLTTASLAVVSMTFALHDGVKLPLPVVVPFGLLWGVVILNIDRYLVISMGSIRDRGRLLWMGLPRLGMAIILALVISTPLVLRVFASDIQTELYTMRLELSKQQQNLEAGSKEALQANQIAGQIQADKSVLAGSVPGKFSSPALQADQQTVSSLQAQEAQAQHTAEVAYRAYVCEYAGLRCHGASGVPGGGNLTSARFHQWRQDVSALNSIKQKLQSATNAESAAENSVKQSKSAALAKAQAQARAALPGLEKQYNSLEAFLRRESAQGTDLNGKNTGILAQVHALSNLDSRDPALLFTHLLVAALFFMIELLPVVVKILTNLGPISAYDVVLTARDEEVADGARAHRIERRRIEETGSQERIRKEEMESQERILIAEGESHTRVSVEEGTWRTRIKLEDDMRNHEEGLGKQANQHVASEMETILDCALREWSERVRSGLSSASQKQTANGSPTSSNATADAAFGMPDPDNI